MEAVPRLPMLSCELKESPSNSEFGPVLKKYIKEHYHEDPESYNKEIKDLESLRQSAIKVSHDFTGCSTLKRYYSQLHCLQGRFVMAEDGPACVPFTWTDIYSGMVFNITDIKYEQACILYNIGALHSELGAIESRVSAEGMKIACTHFQCAAWAFQHLRENFPQPKGTDMSHDLLTFFINVMLAQAQECILEKSMLDSRKSSITAKVAAQVVEYYRMALVTLQSGSSSSGSSSTENDKIADVVGSKLFKTWKKFVEFKMAFYSSISNLYMGNQAEEQQKMGERVAWFTLALDKLNEAIKLAKSAERDDLSEALIFTMDVVGNKHNNAKKENDFVYHEKVPAIESLPEVKGASLVKGIPFSTTDPDVCGQDIFVRLVPMETHEASSVYSEEKAKLLRSLTAKVEDKDQELTTYLSSLQLDQSVLSTGVDTIPQELLEKCAAMSVRQNVVEEVTSLLKALSDLSKEVEEALVQIVGLLEQDKQKEQLHQESFGKRAPSMIIVELRKECSKYEEAHKRANESNSKLEKMLTDHMDNLKLLCGSIDDLKKTLPSVTVMDTEDDTVAQELKRLLDKVDEMRQQRQMLESQLREALQNDDITKRLVMKDKNTDIQDICEEELKKHSQRTSLLEQNLSAQDNILRALTNANAHYASTRKQKLEILSRREAMIMSLINSFDSYEDLTAKAQKGIEFYQKLQTNVSRLLTRARSVTKVQDEERAQIAEAQTRKAGKSVDLKSNFSGVSGPKLKDYLPYMIGRAGSTAFSSGTYTQQTVSLATDSSIPQRDFQFPMVSASEYPTIPQNVANAAPSPKVTADHLPYHEPTPVSAVPSTAAMGIRPAPVGSEQTTAAHCTATTYTASYTVNSINKPISSNQCYSQQFQPFSYQQYGQQNIPSSSQYAEYSYSGQQLLPNSSTQNLYSQAELRQSNQLRDSSTLQQQYLPASDVNKYGISATTNYQTPPIPLNQAQNASYAQLQYSAQYPVQSPASLQSQYPVQQIQSTVGMQTQYPMQVPNSSSVYQQYYMQYLQNSSATQYPSQQIIGTSSIQYPVVSSANIISGTSQLPGSYSTHMVTTTAYSHIPNSSGIQTSQFSTYAGSQVIGSANTVQQSWPAVTTVTTCYGHQQPYYQQPNSDSVAATGQTATTYCYSQTPQVSSLIGQQKEATIQTNQNFISNLNNTATNYAHQNYVPQHSGLHDHNQMYNGIAQNEETARQQDVLHPVSSNSNQPQPAIAAISISSSIASAEEPNDILSSSMADKITTEQQLPILKPKPIPSTDALVKDSQELERTQPKDPLSDNNTLDKFIGEVEKFEKFVEGLTRKSLNGPTALDQKWKELLDTQDRESRKLAISVARCYPMKNRYPDIMPYDGNRVVLSSLKNDYINASFIKDVTKSSVPYIITQAPLPSSVVDFWTMVWEQQTEIIVCLLCSTELKSHVYWPSERAQPVQHGSLAVSLQSMKEKQYCTERILSVCNNETRMSRVVIHLQFPSFPASGVPASPSHLLQFIGEVHNYHRQQRNLARPVVVHCSGGIGRSGVFCLLSASIKETAAGRFPLDVSHIAARMSQQRKFLIQEKDHLKFCYDAILYYAQDILMKRGILTNKAKFDNKLPSQHTHARHPSADFILGADGISKLQSGMAKLGLADDPEKQRGTEQEPEQQTEKPSGENSTPSDIKDDAPHTEEESLTPNTINEATPATEAPPTTTSSSITSLLDPATFTLDTTISPNKKRITKDQFNARSSSLDRQDPKDPLSQLDPLWSLKKS